MQPLISAPSDGGMTLLIVDTNRPIYHFKGLIALVFIFDNVNVTVNLCVRQPDKASDLKFCDPVGKRGGLE